MRGLTLDGVETITFRADLPEPVIEADTDAIIKVERAGLCGSDLHPYLGRESVRPGVIPGHEVIGTVIALGGTVERFAVGQRVVVPFTTSCGECVACRRGLSSRCAHGELFGYGDPTDSARPPLQGGQAEMVRVPLADGTLVEIPEGLSDEQAVLLADNFPTGWHAARQARTRPGRPVAIVGLGSVGLSAVVAARTMGAGPILALDPVEDRRARARRLGARTAHPSDAGTTASEMTESGFPSVVDATGALPGQGLAFRLLQPGGVLSVIAVPTSERFAFTPVETYDKNATVTAGRAPVRSLLDLLIPLIGRVPIPADVIVTHPNVPIEEGPEAYRRFASREGGMVKALFSF
jgi:threonine dehydrogenase-like Zn-dependent dehydrogenase